MEKFKIFGKMFSRAVIGLPFLIGGTVITSVAKFAEIIERKCHYDISGTGV